MPETSTSKNNHQFRIHASSYSRAQISDTLQDNTPLNHNIPLQSDLQHKFRAVNTPRLSQIPSLTNQTLSLIDMSSNNVALEHLRVRDDNWRAKVAATEVWPHSPLDTRIKHCFLQFYSSQTRLPIFTCGVCALLVEDELCYYWLLNPINSSRIELLLTDENKNLCVDNCGLKTSTSGSKYVRTCNQCWKSLQKGQLPSFSLRNGFNYGCYSDMPNYLKNLTLVEERLISPFRTYGFIAKILENHTSIANYRKTRGHIIVVPQDPSPLF